MVYSSNTFSHSFSHWAFLSSLKGLHFYLQDWNSALGNVNSQRARSTPSSFPAFLRSKPESFETYCADF